MNRGENFLKMLAAWQAMDDTNHELIIADFGSTDVDVPCVVSGLADVRIVKLQGPFNRSRGLNAAAANATGDLLFFLDSDVLVPKGFCNIVRSHVHQGQAYFPVCYSLNKGSPAESSAPGWWRHTGFGLCGLQLEDVKRIAWDESFTRWGKEDNDLLRRAEAELAIVRSRCPGLLHLWHPDDLAFKNRYHAPIDNANGLLHAGKSVASHPSVGPTVLPSPLTWHVVVPCHNYGQYLEEAVGSALANKVNLHVTIVDDASTDDTATIAGKLMCSDNRISYISHRRRTDVSAARNDGVASRPSRFVCLLDADDKLGGGYLAAAQQELENGSDCVCPDMYLFGDVQAVWQVPAGDLRNALLSRNRIPYASAFRREWWARLGGFDECMPNWQDYDFWLRMVKAGANFIRLAGQHFHYRRHRQSKALRPGTDRERVRAIWRYLRRKHNDLPRLGDVPEASQNELKEKFAREFAYWHNRLQQEGGRLKATHYERFFTDHFGFPKDFYHDKRVLDVGCGPRGSLEWAAMASECVGLDPLAEEYATLGCRGDRMRYVTAHAEEMPLPDGHFDVVASFNSLDHVDNPLRAIREIHRVLRPGGYFLLMVDIHSSLTSCEPSAVDWDIIEACKPGFKTVAVRQYERSPQGLYESIDADVVFDHDEPATRYGVLSAKLRKT